jgi:hypothetical protein
MPITYEVDHEHHLVICHGHGVFTDADVFGYQQEVWSRPDVAGYSELVDMSEVERIEDPKTERIRELAKLAASMDVKGSASRMAIVASEDHAYGLGRMFQTFRELDPRSTKEVGVFRTMAEALAYLNITIAPGDHAKC